MKQKKWFIIVGVWLFLSLALPFLHEGLSRDIGTRLLVLAYFLLGLCWFYQWGRLVEVVSPKKTFIIWCIFNAMWVEVFHMISRPLHKSLLITANTSPWQALKNTSIDLILTVPAYALIFWVIWRLVERYHYSPFSFFFLMALGQALGDGGGFFLVNPGALIVIPYVMLNYWAMNFVPYLVVQNHLPTWSSQESKWKEIILPLILLPLTYLIAGGSILTLGKVLGWIPK